MLNSRKCPGRAPVLLLLCLAPVLSLLGPSALAARGDPEPAASPSKNEAARAHYQRGAVLYRQADYSGAWLQFTTAYQLVPRSELLFNMARCEVRLGRSQEALDHFRKYLDAIPNDPDAAGIRREMEDLQVEVDRQNRASQERAREDASLQAAQNPPRPARSWPLYGTIAGAGTVLVGVIGVALLGAVASQYNNLSGFCAPNCRGDQVQPLQQQAVAGYVFLGLTAAGAATTAALLTIELRRRPRERATAPAALVASPGGALALGWRF